MNLEDKSINEIGPDLQEHYYQYKSGILVNDGCIYCMPYGTTNHFLKITPKEGEDAEVHILEDLKLPMEGDSMWKAGVLAKDGCVYYFPHQASRILKFDPSNMDGDKLTLVGEDLSYLIPEGSSFNLIFEGAVLGNDNCIYGISRLAIIKFDPSNLTVSQLSGECDLRYHYCHGGVLANDGNIYTINSEGKILKVDLIKQEYSVFGKVRNTKSGFGWGPPVIGADSSIYFPPFRQDQVLQYNHITQTISLHGECSKLDFYYGGILASDGYIYCIPFVGRNLVEVDTRPMNEKVLELIQNTYEMQALASCTKRNIRSKFKFSHFSRIFKKLKVSFIKK